MAFMHVTSGAMHTGKSQAGHECARDQASAGGGGASSARSAANVAALVQRLQQMRAGALRRMHTGSEYHEAVDASWMALVHTPTDVVRVQTEVALEIARYGAESGAKTLVRLPPLPPPLRPPERGSRSSRRRRRGRCQRL